MNPLIFRKEDASSCLVPSAAETLYEGVWAVTVSGNNPRFTTDQIKPYTN